MIDCEGFVHIIRILSAYRLILCSSSWNLRPEISGDFRIISAKGSIERVKIREKRGNPCLVPFDIENCLEKT